MALVTGPNNESYDEFFKQWTDEQQKLAQELRDGLNADKNDKNLLPIVEKVEKHYQEYYKVKDKATKQDVLRMMQPPWRSPLENAFLWIGGWRPTMVFQLAYAQAGQQIEADLAEFLSGLDTPSMTSLSSKQLAQISKLQVRSQKSEEELGHHEALIQQSLADQPLLTLAQANNEVESSEHQNGEGSTMSDALDEKVKALEELMRAADELRVESLREFLKLLTPTQAAQYLVAASQLFEAMRRIGKMKEEGGSGSGHSQDSH